MAKKAFSYPGVLEIRDEDGKHGLHTKGGGTFVPIQLIFRRPDLQARLVNKRQYTRIVNQLLKLGLVVPYIGPETRRSSGEAQAAAASGVG
jgi:hypothetical protein